MSMDKNVGFNRNILRAWLDAAAAFRVETGDLVELRARLEPVVGREISSAENRRKAIDILIRIWGKTADQAPALHRLAVAYFAAMPQPQDRLWLHYGLSLLAYPLFRQVAAALGQLGRHEEAITPAVVKQRLVAERGELGSLNKAVERILFSMRDWGLVADSGQRHAYRLQRKAVPASQPEVEVWMSACALYAHPAEELPFNDLLRLPELFPFQLTLSVDQLRRHPGFVVQRQGDGWDMVRLASAGKPALASDQEM